MDRQPLDVDTGLVQLVEQLTERVDGAVCGDLEDELVLVGSGRREELGRRVAAGRGSAKWSRTWPPGMRLFNSAGVPSATIRPWSSTAIRSASWSASSRYWVVSRMVTPAAASSRTICHMVRRLRGSKPVVGSSRKITRGSTDQGHRQVEPSSHPARVGRQQLVRGVGEVELLQQLGHPPLPGLAAEVAKVGHQAAGSRPR